MACSFALEVVVVVAPTVTAEVDQASRERPAVADRSCDRPSGGCHVLVALLVVCRLTPGMRRASGLGGEPAPAAEAVVDRQGVGVEAREIPTELENDVHLVHDPLDLLALP